MEYSIQQLADLAGVTKRTLRFYDQIGLLPSARDVSSGYRVYTETEVDRLQQILLYRELGFELNMIARILQDSAFDYTAALEVHLTTLRHKEKQLHRLIQTVEKTISKEKGELKMSDQEKFIGLKKNLITENERQYGQEIEEKYGKETVAESNRKIMNLTPDEYARMTSWAEEIKQKLTRAVKSNESPQSETGREIALLHQKWLTLTWPQYTPEAHRGLGEMYLTDHRFKQNYDAELPGCAQFLRDAIHYHISESLT